jgi:hypothetical protein
MKSIYLSEFPSCCSDGGREVGKMGPEITVYFFVRMLTTKIWQ